MVRSRGEEGVTFLAKKFEVTSGQMFLVLNRVKGNRVIDHSNRVIDHR